MDLRRDYIMGRFSPYEKALVETTKGGDYELTESRVMWACHSVIAWLTQTNTSVRQRCIYYFLVFRIKTLYILCIHHVYVL